MRDDEPRPVWMSLPITHWTREEPGTLTQGVCVFYYRGSCSNKHTQSFPAPYDSTPQLPGTSLLSREN